MLSFPPAAADIDAEKRAAQDVASLQEDVSHPQRSASLEVPALAQNPELPTGCESVALTNALLSLGFNLGKTGYRRQLASLERRRLRDGVHGRPAFDRRPQLHGPGNRPNRRRYLAAQGSSLEATDITGSSLDQVLDQVAGGNPVIAWCTIGLEPPGAAYRTARETAAPTVYTRTATAWW